MSRSKSVPPGCNAFLVVVTHGGAVYGSGEGGENASRVDFS